MAVLTGVLLGVVLLKAFAIGNAIAWLYRHGTAYRRLYDASPPATLDEQERLYDEARAGFLPFGLKDYRLRRTARTRRMPLALAAVPVRLFRAFLFNFAWLTVICAAYLIVTSHLLPRRAWLHDILGLALIFVLMVIPIMLAMEAIYSYNRLGSYATAFHETRPERRTPENQLLREFNAYVGALITANISGLTALYFISARFGGYPQLTTLPTDLAGVGKRVVACAYATLSTFFGAADPMPTGVAARLATGMIQLQGFALLLVVLAAMLSHAAGGPPPAPPAPAAPSQAPRPSRDPQPDSSSSTSPWRQGVAGAIVGSALTVVALAWWRNRRR